MDVQKARKEVQKANTLLITRFGPESQVLAHLTRAIEYLLPDEPEASPLGAVAVAAPEETTVEVVSEGIHFDDPGPLGDEGVVGEPATEEIKPPRATRQRRRRK